MTDTPQTSAKSILPPLAASTLPRLAPRAWFLVLALGACFVPRAAKADGATAERREIARRYFDQGASLLKKEEWAPALEAFEKSRALFPSRGNTRNVAVCLRQLGRYPEALDMFESLRRSFDLPTADRSAVEAEMEELRDKFGFLAISANEAGATIRVDDQESGTTPLQTPLRLATGVRAVHITKLGYRDVDMQVGILPRREHRIEVLLEAERPPTPLAVGPPAPRLVASEPGQVQRILGWSALGAAAAVGATSVFFGMKTLDERNQYEASGYTDLQAREDGVSARTWTNATAAVAVALGVTGVVLLVTMPKRTSASLPHAGSTLRATSLTWSFH